MLFWQHAFLITVQQLHKLLGLKIKILMIPRINGAAWLLLLAGRMRHRTIPTREQARRTIRGIERTEKETGEIHRVCEVELTGSFQKR
jgi:hypothetical protein